MKEEGTGRGKSIEHAFRQLRQGSSFERLQAARLLGQVAEARHIAELQALRAQERDSWVRSALDATIRKLTIGGATEEVGQSWVSHPADAETEDIQARALQNAAQTIIHEIRQILRLLTSAATREVDNYAASATGHEIKRLDSFLEAIDRLQAAAGSPKIIEFDIRDLVLKTIRECGFNEGHVAVFRAEPLTVSGDPDLLQIALRNLLCNAVEASEDGQRVTVNFATNDREAWVVVLDDGRGLPASSEKAWEPGVTSKSKKEGHFGWGLPIAQRAVHSFRGSISLTPRESGGTSAEIRWKINGEEGNDESPDR